MRGPSTPVGSGLRDKRRGLGASGRVGSGEEALSAEPGEAHQQCVPGGFKRSGLRIYPIGVLMFFGKREPLDIRAYLSRRFPALASRALVESRVCQYENGSNGDLLIDRHSRLPNALLVGAGSGQGFKHGPAIGRYAAGLLIARLARIEHRFNLASKGEVLVPRAGGRTPRLFHRATLRGGLAAIRDFRYVPYVGREAEIVLAAASEGQTS